jgi:hypothetical protein
VPHVTSTTDATARLVPAEWNIAVVITYTSMLSPSINGSIDPVSSVLA